MINKNTPKAGKGLSDLNQKTVGKNCLFSLLRRILKLLDVILVPILGAFLANNIGISGRKKS